MNNIHLKKKALGNFTMPLVVIVGMVTLVLLLILFKQIADGAEEHAMDSRCKASVTAYAKIKNLPIGDVKGDAADIDCPTKFVTIEKSTPLSMRREVADLMYQCWYNYGEGKLRLFSAKDTKFCAVCSVFQFEDKSTQLDRMVSFLMSERIPSRLADGTRPTYFEYISKVQTSPTVVDAARQTDTNFLSGTHRYAVMFTYYKQSYWSKVSGILAGAAVGGTIAVATVAVAGVITYFSAGTGVVVAGAIVKVGFTTALVVGASVGAAVGGTAAGGEVFTEGADWDARLVMTPYSPEDLKNLGCDEIPVSMLDKKFR
ncbi:MAG: hypothetical protein V1729_04170 [Candidatus Woesearchaeota archaeon]